MAIYNFGLGSLTLIPSGANPTPIQVGVLSDISVDISSDVKELRGQWQGVVDACLAARKISGKVKAATIRSDLLLAALPGATVATGSVLPIVNEQSTSGATRTVANSATFSEDLGVYDVTAGKPLTRVASGPATGQYSVAAGVYTINASDTSHTLWISYSYTTTTGTTITLPNQLMGQVTSYGLRCYDVSNGKAMSIYLPAVFLPKFSFGLKAEAYTEYDVEFTAMQDPSSNTLVKVFLGE